MRGAAGAEMCGTPPPPAAQAGPPPPAPEPPPQARHTPPAATAHVGHAATTASHVRHAATATARAAPSLRGGGRDEGRRDEKQCGKHGETTGTHGGTPQ